MKKFVKFLLILFIIFLLIILSLNFLLVSRGRPNYSLNFDKQDLMALRSLFYKMSKDKIALQNLKDILLDKPQKIVISNKEFNALSKIAIVKQNNLNNNVIINNLFIDKGIINLNITYKLNFWTPFGQDINLRLDFIPSIYRDNIDLKIKALKVGYINLQNLDTKIQLNKSYFANNLQVYNFLNSITDLYIENNNIVIDYSPMILKNLIFNRVTQ